MFWERLTVARQHVFGQKRAVWRVMRRCLHENKRSHTFKSGEIMWVCDCGAGGGHYDQSTPIEGKLYRKGGVVAEEIDTDGAEQTQEEIAELSVPTFSLVAALQDAEVPTPDLESDSGEEVEEEECVQEL